MGYTNRFILSHLKDGVILLNYLLAILAIAAACQMATGTAILIASGQMFN